MPQNKQAAQEGDPLPFLDNSEVSLNLLKRQASKIVRLYAVNAAMAEAIAPLVFLEALR
jgi:hypothetical protein